MTPKNNIRHPFSLKILSILMSVFVLNLCILVPVPATCSECTEVVSGITKQKKSNRFFLEIALDYLADRDCQIPDSASTGLLEELREDWHHEVAYSKDFHGYYTENIHGSYTDLLFTFMEDARFSPPPEYRS